MILSTTIVLLGLIASISTSDIISTYPVQLTTSSQSYSRDGISGSVYYYQALEVRVPTTGTYIFESSGSGSLDTHGYLYQGNFYPNYSQYNKLAENDDRASYTREFQFTAELRSDIRYIVIATTHPARRTGSFTVTATGTASVSMSPIIINT